MRIERVGNTELSLDHWDCECDADYVHPITETTCSICGAEEVDRPNSRVEEVLQ